jgi:urease beta subunit
MEGDMLDTPNDYSGRQAINRRIFEVQRKIRADGQPTAVGEHYHHADRDTDLPFSRADVRLEVQKWWWQL